MYNETNIIEKLKFKKANISRFIYLIVVFLWIFGYFMIKWAENNQSQANVYYIFGLAFAGISFATAKFIKNDRDKTLNFFKFGLLGYVLFIILWEAIIMGAKAGGDENTAQWLMTFCMYTKIMIPIGLIIWQAKKWTFLTGINKNKRDTIDHLKNHGNDGMN